MAYLVQQEFEVFLAESIGLQLANLRHHLALCSLNDGRDQRPPTKEQFAQICEFIEAISQEAQRLHERLKQEEVATDASHASGEHISIVGPTQFESKRSRFSEEQIITILKQHESGVATEDVCREHGISSATFYK